MCSPSLQPRNLGVCVRPSGNSWGPEPLKEGLDDSLSQLKVPDVSLVGEIVQIRSRSICTATVRITGVDVHTANERGRCLRATQRPFTLASR